MRRAVWRSICEQRASVRFFFGGSPTCGGGRDGPSIITPFELYTRLGSPAYFLRCYPIPPIVLARTSLPLPTRIKGQLSSLLPSSIPSLSPLKSRKLGSMILFLPRTHACEPAGRVLVKERQLWVASKGFYERAPVAGL